MTAAIAACVSWLAGENTERRGWARKKKRKKAVVKNKHFSATSWRIYQSEAATHSPPTVTRPDSNETPKTKTENKGLLRGREIRVRE